MSTASCRTGYRDSALWRLHGLFRCTTRAGAPAGWPTLTRRHRAAGGRRTRRRSQHGAARERELLDQRTGQLADLTAAENGTKPGDVEPRVVPSPRRRMPRADALPAPTSASRPPRASGSQATSWQRAIVPSNSWAGLVASPDRCPHRRLIWTVSARPLGLPERVGVAARG